MKKKYFKPEFMVVEIKHSQALLGSSEKIKAIKNPNDPTSIKYDMDYGGIDEDGELDPD